MSASKKYLLSIAIIFVTAYLSEVSGAEPTPLPFPLVTRISNEPPTHLGNRVEDAAANLIRSQKGEVLLDRHNKGVPQGPDIIYRDPSGVLVVAEVKAAKSTATAADLTAEGLAKKCLNILNYKSTSPDAIRTVDEAIDGLASGKTRFKFIREGDLFVMDQFLADMPKAKADEIVSHRNATYKPSVKMTGNELAQHLGSRANIDQAKMMEEMTQASREITNLGQSRFVRHGKNVLRFVGKASGPAGVAIGVYLYTGEAAEIEADFQADKLTREQADAAHAKLALTTTAEASGGFGGLVAGAAIGTMICPGVGTVIGGIAGAVGGSLGAETVMAAIGLSDRLSDFLAPGAETIRQACSYVKDQGKYFAHEMNDQIREWVGAETCDKVLATPQVVWDRTRSAIVQTKTVIIEKAEVVGEKIAETATTVGETVSDGADWSWSKAKAVWRYVR